MAARFEMYRDPADGWRWRLRDQRGVTIADCAQSHESSERCRREIQSVRQNAFKAALEEPSGPAPGRRGPHERRPPSPETSESGAEESEPKNPLNAAA